MTLVCSVGSTEPWNGAGLGLDARILAELGARCVWVVAGVTAQDRSGLHGGVPMSADMIEAQFDALGAAAIDAYRVGALLDRTSVHVVARRLRDTRAPIVYDPALGPSAGGRFVDDAMRTAIRNEIFALASVVTPNLAEAAYFCGFPVENADSMERAGKALLAFGAGAALIKGGHLAGRTIDVLVDHTGARRFEAQRIEGEMRGTGCVLASALAVELGRGAALPDAVARARELVRVKLAAAVELGGMRLCP